MLVIFGAGMAVRPQWAAVFTNDPQVGAIFPLGKVGRGSGCWDVFCG